MTAAVLLLALGLGLIVAEVLFPSFGILSVLATVALVASIAMAFQDSTATGVQFLIATALLVPAVILLGFKILPRSPLGRRLVIAGGPADGKNVQDPRDLLLLGQEGTIEAACRPAGMARLDGRRVDVVTRGEWIEAGERVKVIEVEGNRVVVTRSAQPS